MLFSASNNELSRSYGDEHPPERGQRVIRVALAGNPNSGKTTIFNALTGARQKVANYPGVTVETKKGHFHRSSVRYEIVDLPGTYSLTSFSPEELIARNEIREGKPDVTVVVVDSTNLERNLYLLVQIMELGANPVLCLNMSDEAKQAGQVLEIRQMEKLLGFPVVETVAHKERGIDRLKVLIGKAADRSRPAPRLVLGERLDGILDRLQEMVQPEEYTDNALPLRWIMVKLLENDEFMRGWIRHHFKDPDRILESVCEEQDRITTETEKDPVLYVADRRYGFISGLLREVRRMPPRLDARVASDWIDSVLCNKVIGFPIFLLVITTVFWLTFTLGAYPMAWIETLFEHLNRLIADHWPEESMSLLRSLIKDGIIAGVGGVIVFLPNILILFFGLAFLEDTGYMARVAFLMDNILHRFGLHGKSFIPMLTGFGCSIPGIMATRTLENERDRLTTMMVLPLMSCGARLPIYLLIIPAFFPRENSTYMLLFIYLLGILVAAGLAKLLRVTVLAGEDAPFVMELPPYRLPTAKAVALKMWDRSWLYLRKAGTVILGISIVLWALSSFPEKEEFTVDMEVASGAQLSEEEIEYRRAAESLEESVVGRIGRGIEPLIEPMGFDWRIGTALIGAFAAKEVFVAQMGIVFSMGEAESSSETLRSTLQETYTPLTAICLMIFLLIATPCMATVAVTRLEAGGWKWPLLQFGGLTLIAYVLCVLVYQVGMLIGV
ncbi:MAG: ferrous iron transport protein B [Planctomycetota bacterium]|jgi:ferrous iron transport protein B